MSEPGLYNQFVLQPHHIHVELIGQYNIIIMVHSKKCLTYV